MVVCPSALGIVSGKRTSRHVLLDLVERCLLGVSVRLVMAMESLRHVASEVVERQVMYQ